MSNVVKMVVWVVVGIVGVILAVVAWRNRGRISAFGKRAVSKGEQVLSERKSAGEPIVVELDAVQESLVVDLDMVEEPEAKTELTPRQQAMESGRAAMHDYAEAHYGVSYLGLLKACRTLSPEFTSDEFPTFIGEHEAEVLALARTFG